MRLVKELRAALAGRGAANATAVQKDVMPARAGACDPSPHARGELRPIGPHGVELCRRHRNQGRQSPPITAMKEGTVDRPARSTDMVSDRVHPLVLKAAGGLLVWFVAAAWLLFDDAGYMKLALAMISVLVFMALAIAAALLRTSVREEQRNA